MFIGHYASGLAFYMQKPAGKTTFFILVLGTQIAALMTWAHPPKPTISQT